MGLCQTGFTFFKYLSVFSQVLSRTDFPCHVVIFTSLFILIHLWRSIFSRFWCKTIAGPCHLSAIRFPCLLLVRVAFDTGLVQGVPSP